VPAEHKWPEGAEVTGTPEALPQEPLINSCAEHCAAAPPLEPVQSQDQGPLPDTAEAVPAEHKLLEGAEVNARPSALPHVPSDTSCAEHCAVAPPLEPAQSQDQGPVPDTLEAVPAEHKSVEGAEVTSVPLALPQAPCMAAP
jgi:hypothetical protein